MLDDVVPLERCTMETNALTECRSAQEPSYGPVRKSNIGGQRLPHRSTQSHTSILSLRAYGHEHSARDHG
jgi:hypothetical protein